MTKRADTNPCMPLQGHEVSYSQLSTPQSSMLIKVNYTEMGRKNLFLIKTKRCCVWCLATMHHCGTAHRHLRYVNEYVGALHLISIVAVVKKQSVWSIFFFFWGWISLYVLCLCEAAILHSKKKGKRAKSIKKQIIIAYSIRTWWVVWIYD